MNDAIAAWKDAAFRASLTPEQVASMPAHPAGATWSALGQSEVKQILGAVSDGDSGALAESGGYICTVTTEECVTTWCCP